MLLNAGTNSDWKRFFSRPYCARRSWRVFLPSRRLVVMRRGLVCRVLPALR